MFNFIKKTFSGLNKTRKNIVNTFSKFHGKKYLNDTDNINYEFIWDLICEPKNKKGVLYKTGINLIILNVHDFL